MGLPQGKSKVNFQGQRQPWFKFFFIIKEIHILENVEKTDYGDDLSIVDK